MQSLKFILFFIMGLNACSQDADPVNSRHATNFEGENQISTVKEPITARKGSDGNETDELALAYMEYLSPTNTAFRVYVHSTQVDNNDHNGLNLTGPSMGGMSTGAAGAGMSSATASTGMPTLSKKAFNKVLKDCLDSAIKNAPSGLPTTMPGGKSKVCGAVPSCKVSMSANQCEANFIILGACITFQHLLSSCISAATMTPINHSSKIQQWMNALTKCMACGMKDNIDDVAKVVLKPLSKFLGPIGVAVTVGEIGAFAITTYGDYYSKQMAKEYACSMLDSVKDSYKSATDAWHKAKGDFEGKYCGLSINVTHDTVGPTGGTLEPQGCTQDVTEQEGMEATMLLQSAAEALNRHLRWQRIKNIYTKECGS